MSKEVAIPEKVVYICTSGKCKKKGSKNIYKLLKSILKERGLRKKINIIKTDCTDRCKFGPVVCVQPENNWLYYMDEAKSIRIFEDAICGCKTEKGSLPVTKE